MSYLLTTRVSPKREIYGRILEICRENELEKFESLKEESKLSLIAEAFAKFLSSKIDDFISYDVIHHKNTIKVIENEAKESIVKILKHIEGPECPESFYVKLAKKEAGIITKISADKLLSQTEIKKITSKKNPNSNFAKVSVIRDEKGNVLNLLVEELVGSPEIARALEKYEVACVNTLPKYLKSEVKVQYSHEEGFTVKVSAKNNKSAEMLIARVEKLMKEAEAQFSEKIFVKYFFNALYANELTDLTGEKAQNLYIILDNAKQTFPCFKRLTLIEQIKVLRKANKNVSELHALAKNVFFEFENNNLIEEVIFEGRSLKKFYENRQDIRDIDNPRYVFKRNALIWVGYKDSMGFRRGINAFNLWNLLAQTDMAV